MAGRKNKYETCVKPHLKKINKKIREGVTEYEIAKALGISIATLNNYKIAHPELVEALQKNKGADVLQKLVNAGIEAAIGYYKENEVTTIIVDENGEATKKQRTITKTWYPPNASLHKLYLLNFGKSEGFTTDPLDLELKKAKQELDEFITKQKNFDIDF